MNAHSQNEGSFIATGTARVLMLGAV